MDSWAPQAGLGWHWSGSVRTPARHRLRRPCFPFSVWNGNSVRFQPLSDGHFEMCLLPLKPLNPATGQENQYLVEKPVATKCGCLSVARPVTDHHDSSAPGTRFSAPQPIFLHRTPHREHWFVTAHGGHLPCVQAMVKDYEGQLQWLRQRKDLEVDAVTSATSHTRYRWLVLYPHMGLRLWSSLFYREAAWDHGKRGHPVSSPLLPEMLECVHRGDPPLAPFHKCLNSVIE